MTTIRGAITIKNNDADEIINASTKLLEKIIARNEIEISDISFILFTATKDIDKAYPAVAARRMGITEASLMCMQEMYVCGSLPMCIRVMVAVNSVKTQAEAVHCYMENAEALRPDLKFYSVAIDGPTASGKSSVSKEAAKRLGFRHVETGALYRAVGLHCLRRGITDKEGIINELDKFQLTVELSDEGQRTFLDGEDVTEEIRSQEAAKMSSDVAVIGEVRAKLLPLQRSLSEKHNIIMDGRDIQTVVLPDADIKIFITATLDERTKRRCIDLEKKGEKNSFETVKRQIMERDAQDSGRDNAPLIKSAEAREIDTTEMTFDEAVDNVIALINEGLNKTGGE